MKKAFGLVEILIVCVVIIILFVICLKPNSSRNNPFEELKEVNTQSQIIDEKIKTIEDTKALKNKIEENLQKGY